MRFISSRLETRTKESIRYASIRVDKTQECVMKVKEINRNFLKYEVFFYSPYLYGRIMKIAILTDYNF